AVPVIMGEIKGLFRRGGTVKVSRSLKEIAMKAAKFTQEYQGIHGQEPSISILSEHIGVPEDRTVEALCACRQPLSLTVSEDGGEESGQVDVPIESGEERIAERLSLEQELKSLSDDDRNLISLRYFKGLTQSQTAKLLGTTQVQISRREKKILCGLRERLAG
ncbi:MAG: sigma-70 family RNA polymerase sigma factor, partial [Lachnospiraceae bacterium]|nr:sigma-70 family RNA polymerase sigma factor [Lachnospiraceae bacterium]